MEESDEHLITPRDHHWHRLRGITWILGVTTGLLIGGAVAAYEAGSPGWVVVVMVVIGCLLALVADWMKEPGQCAY